MSTLSQMKEGLSRAWDTVMDGWRELVERAGEALTRFHPRQGSSDAETHEDRIARDSARWGVLAAEVQQDEDEVEVAIEVAGMQPDDFDIQVIDDLLVIRGEKRVERTRSSGQYHIMERAYGAFERAVRLPAQVEASEAKARYERGVLHVTLPKSPVHRTKRISVKSA